MNKQDLRYSYIGYFASQYAKKEDIDFDTLENIAAGDNDLEREVLNELINEGLIEGIEVFEDEYFSTITQYKGKLRLTAKGIKEILNLFPKEKKALIDDIKFDINNDKNKDNSILESKKGKYLSIKHDLLILFADIAQNKQYTKNINNKNISQNINSIIKKYYYRACPRNKEIINELEQEKLITINYESIKELDDLRKIISINGIEFLQKNYDYKFEILDEDTKNQLKENTCNIQPRLIPNNSIRQEVDVNLGLSTDDLKFFAGIYENLPQNHIKQVAKMLNTDGYKSTVNMINQNIGNINTAMKIANQMLGNIKESDITNKYEVTNKTYNKQFGKIEYTFEGILGQNCGDYITINNYNKDDRLPERIINEKTGQHFIIKNGIKVLRGFAKASDLYNASEPDKKNYQRNEDDIHLEEISKFIDEMNPSGKYLPELTFIARGGYELHRPDWGKKLQTTQLGYFKNTNYYQLHLKGSKLYRIDGNHRLEAMQRLSAKKNQEYYIPFAIILMGKQVLFEDADQIESSLGLEFSGNYGLADDKDEKKIVDMEAFLFYFLNAKAKKLTTEENYRGLISSNWEEHEIMIANKNIILLQYLEKIIKDDILHNDFCDNQPLKQISEILDNIHENIELKKFKKIIKIMNNLLAKNCWNNLKKFDFYCQLIFYVSYKHEEEVKCEQILNNLEYWVQKYDFDNTTFDNPILLYNNAKKTNNIDPINIFVAMPFDQSNIGNFTEWIETAIKNIETENPKYKNRLNLYKIMTHRGYNIDLMDDIMDKINNCSIFIAEISPCTYIIDNEEIDCDANPNVMYELGIASNLKKPVILMREISKFPKVPSDIQEKYRNIYSRTNAREAREILQKSIKAVIEDYFDKT